MKPLFLILFLASLIGGLISIWSEPDLGSDVPILYLTTNPSPSDLEDLEKFHEWLVETGRVVGDGKPSMELHIDPAGRDKYKQMVHGVSGIASDLQMGTMAYMQNAGMLADITEVASARGFDAGSTYPSLAADFMIEGRQYGFPMSAYVATLWASVETFEKYGMDPPPRYWDYQTFEKMGREFVKRANPSGQRKIVFFLNGFKTNNNQRFIRAMHRDAGLDDFNETMTRCTLGDERFARALERVYRWTYVDKIVASPADTEAFASAASAGYGGDEIPLFYHGHYGMVALGRMALIRWRQFSRHPRLSVSYFPFDEFISTNAIALNVGIYEQSPNRELAFHFLEYLTSEVHNRHIIKSCYGIPPVPAFTELDEFLRPARYPNEWGVHEAQATAAKTFCIERPHSPFAPLEPTYLAKRQAMEKVLNGLREPTAAALEVGEKLNAEIQRSIRESSRLKVIFEKRLALQEKIESYREEGRKVPAEWLLNPFHRRYYAFRGWSTEPVPEYMEKVGIERKLSEKVAGSSL